MNGNIDGNTYIGDYNGIDVSGISNTNFTVGNITTGNGTFQLGNITTFKYTSTNVGGFFYDSTFNKFMSSYLFGQLDIKKRSTQEYGLIVRDDANMSNILVNGQISMLGNSNTINFLKNKKVYIGSANNRLDYYMSHNRVLTFPVGYYDVNTFIQYFNTSTTNEALELVMSLDTNTSRLKIISTAGDDFIFYASSTVKEIMGFSVNQTSTYPQDGTRVLLLPNAPFFSIDYDAKIELTSANTQSANGQGTLSITSKTIELNATNILVNGTQLSNPNMTNYYTKTDINTTLGNYPTTTYLTTNHYTKTYIDSTLTNFPTINDITGSYYNKSYIDASFGSVPTTTYLTTNYYDKTYIDNNSNVDFSNYYNKAYIDNSFGSVPTTTYLTTNYYPKTTIDSTFSNYYNKTTIDSTFNNYYNKTTIDSNFYTKTYINTNYYNKTQIDASLTAIQTGATNYWTKTGNDIYNNNTANVGIGKIPTQKLDVSGSLNVSSDIINPKVYTSTLSAPSLKLFYAAKSKLTSNNSYAFAGNVVIQPNSFAQSIQSTFPISLGIEFKYSLYDFSFNLTSVNVQVKKNGTNLTSGVSVSYNNTLPAEKLFSFFGTTSNRYEQFFTNVNVKFETTDTGSTEDTYAIYLSPQMNASNKTSGTITSKYSYVNTDVKDLYVLSYVKFTKKTSSGVNWTTPTISALNVNNAIGDIVVNNIYCRQIYTPNDLNKNYAVIPPRTALLKAATAITQISMLGSQNYAADNDNYNFMLAGDISNSTVYNTGYITIPENVSGFHIQAWGGGGGGGSGCVFSWKCCDLYGGSGGGGGGYDTKSVLLSNYGVDSTCSIGYSVGNGGSGGIGGWMNSTSGNNGANGGDTTVWLNDESGNKIVDLLKVGGGVGGFSGGFGINSASGVPSGVVYSIPSSVFDTSSRYSGSGQNGNGNPSSDTYYNCPTGGGGGAGITNVNGIATSYSGGDVGSINGIPVGNNYGLYSYGTKGRNSAIYGPTSLPSYPDVYTVFGNGGGGGSSSIYLANSQTVSNPYDLQFNGTSQYGILPLATSYAYSTGTVECWLYIPSYPTTTSRAIITKANAYGIFLTTAGKIQLWNFSGSNGVLSTTTLSLNTWYHVAFSFQSGVSNGSKLYINGVLENSLTTTVLNQSTALSIASNGAGGQYLNCAMDEVRIWNAVRTQNDIAYNRYMSLPSTGVGNLMGYWKMDAGTGTTLVNQISGQPSFNLINSPTWTVPSTLGMSLLYKTDEDTTLFVSECNGKDGGVGLLNIQFF